MIRPKSILSASPSHSMLYAQVRLRYGGRARETDRHAEEQNDTCSERALSLEGTQR